MEGILDGKETVQTSSTLSPNPRDEQNDRQDIQSRSPDRVPQAVADVTGQKLESISLENDLICQIRRVLNETADEALITTDKNLKITQWNHAAEELYG
jgi:PAS domain-containing protein